jgi:multidrug efflux system outer membrane protein
MSGGSKLRRPSVETLRNHARIAQLRFDNGYTSYIELLDAERSLFNAEISQAQTTGSLFQALVNLFRSMGGGWVLEIDRIAGTTRGSKISTNGYEVLYANQ